MSKLLYYSTTALCVVGVVFSFIYVWLNFFSATTDLEARNASTITIIKYSRNFSLLFAILSCVLANPYYVSDAIKHSSELCYSIAISWLVVFLGCLAAMMFAIVSKSPFRESLWKSIKSVVWVAVWGFVIGATLSWLLS